MGDYYGNSRKEMVQFIPPNYFRVLEVGCGTGIFRSNLSKKNEYWGVEISPLAAKLAERKLDKVLQGCFFKNCGDIPDDYFDLIICNDVIEHMPDHDLFLQAIRKKLSKGGCLVLSVPNMRHIACLFELLIKKDWRYRDEGVLDRTHLRFFTRNSLGRALKTNGFEIEEIRGINSVISNLPVLRKIAIRIVSLVLGVDVLYLQFGLRSIHAVDI